MWFTEVSLCPCNFRSTTLLVAILSILVVNRLDLGCSAIKNLQTLNPDNQQQVSHRKQKAGKQAGWKARDWFAIFQFYLNFFKIWKGACWVKFYVNCFCSFHCSCTIFVRIPQPVCLEWDHVVQIWLYCWEENYINFGVNEVKCYYFPFTRTSKSLCSPWTV